MTPLREIAPARYTEVQNFWLSAPVRRRLVRNTPSLRSSRRRPGSRSNAYGLWPWIPAFAGKSGVRGQTYLQSFRPL